MAARRHNCYRGDTDGNGSSRETSFSFLLCGLIRVVSRIRNQGVEQHMSQSFRALGVSASVEQALAVRGITMPFPIQSAVLPDALAGRDVLAKSPTGSGKTLAFGLPIVERVDADAPAPAALILVPTRELALQVAGELERIAAPKKLRVAVVYGGAPLPAQAKRARDAHIVVATPGRLQDLVDRKLVR